MIDKAGDIFFNPVTQMVLTALLGLCWAKWRQYSNLYKELMDVGKKYKTITSTTSNGGKHITESEWAEFGKEVVDVLQAGAPLLRRKTVG